MADYSGLMPHLREKITSILAASFRDNNSVRFVLGEGSGYHRRLQHLMRYSLRKMELSGDYFINADQTACAIVTYPHRNIDVLRNTWNDLYFLFAAASWRRLPQTLEREKKINAIRPREMMYYLWYIGVEPQHQQTGRGRHLLAAVLAKADTHKLPVYLETSTPATVDWYCRQGFRVYHQLDIGYMLYFLVRPVS